MWQPLPGLSDGPTDVQFGPGHIVAASSWNSSLTLVDAGAAQVRMTFTLRAPALSLEWGKQNPTHLFFGGAEQHLSVLNAESGSSWDFGGDHSKAISSVCVGPDNLVLSGGFDGMLQLADYRASDRSVFYPLGHKIVSMASSGNYLAVGMLPKQVGIFDIRKISVPILKKELAFKHQLRRVALFNDEFAACNIKSRVIVDQISRSFRADFSFRCHRDEQFSYPVNALAFSRPGILTSAGSDAKIQVWDVVQQKHLVELPRLPKPVYTFSYSNDQSMIVSAVFDDSLAKPLNSTVASYGQLYVSPVPK